MKNIPSSARNQVTRALLATIVASAAAALVTYLVDSSLGGGLEGGFIAMYVLFVAYPFAELFALWKFKVANWIGVGIVFSAAALTGFIASQNGLDSLHLWLDYALETAAAVVLLGVIWLIFNRLPVHTVLRWFAALVAAALVLAGISAYANAQEQNYQRTTEQTSENSVNFQAYVPTSLPAGTKLTGMDLPIANGKQLLDAVDPKAYITLHFTGDLSEGYESKVDSSFNPPASCGPTIPGFQDGTTAEPCRKVTSVGAADVYLSLMPATQPPEQEYFIKTGPTLIELTSPGRELTNAEIADFINSLQPKTPAQIKQLDDSLTPPAR